MNSSTEYCNNKIHFSSSMKFAIKKRKEKGSVQNPVYGLKRVYCSIYKNTNVQCNKQAAIPVQGT